MNPITPVAISAGRLYLRPWQGEDAPHVLKAFEDDLIARWHSARSVMDIAGARIWVARHSDWSNGGHASFAVLAATGGGLLGSVSLHRIDPDQRDAAIGYWTVAEARGQGVAPQAVDAVSRWAFAELRLERVELRHAVPNTASCRVAEKAGYRYEGTTRQSFRYADGRRYDEHLHARLATDAGPDTS